MSLHCRWVGCPPGKTAAAPRVLSSCNHATSTAPVQPTRHPSTLPALQLRPFADQRPPHPTITAHKLEWRALRCWRNCDNRAARAPSADPPEYRMPLIIHQCTSATHDPSTHPSSHCLIQVCQYPLPPTRAAESSHPPTFCRLCNHDAAAASCAIVFCNTTLLRVHPRACIAVMSMRQRTSVC